MTQGPDGDGADAAGDPVVKVIAERMRKYRRGRDWSGQKLADEVTRLGVRWDRSIVANLENGRRGTVSVQELVALSRALDVSPLLLALPLGDAPTVELLPGWPVVTWEAARWWRGDSAFLDDDVETPGADELRWFLDHDAMVKAVLHGLQTETGLAETWLDNLRIQRRNMRQAGIIPPGLPAEVEALGVDDKPAGGQR
jgi:transcriptional regulator with XRE-family HTH domain